MPARHRGANFPTSARSALGCLLGTCPLGTACASSARVTSARSALLLTGARSAPPRLAEVQDVQDEPTYGLTGKKQGKGGGVEPHDMQKTVRKKRAKSCHAKTMQKPCQNHVKIMSCKHAKTMQKPCKNHANMQKPCNMRLRWRLHCEKTCKLFVSCKKQAVPHAMKKPRAKPCEKTCKLFVSCKKQAVPHVMQKPCKNHANMQKPCNMRRVRWRLRRQARQGGFYARQVARNFVAILRQQESAMEQF